MTGRRQDRSCGSGPVSQYQRTKYAGTSSSVSFGLRMLPFTILPADWVARPDGKVEAEVLHGITYTKWYIVQIMNDSTGATDTPESDDRNTDGVWKCIKNEPSQYITRVTIIG